MTEEYAELPQYGSRFVMFVDACTYRKAAILIQTENEKERELGLASKPIKLCEVKYTNRELAFLVLTHAIRKWRKVIVDQEIQVCTYHQALLHFRNLKYRNN